jgi:hypothetical protein
LYKGLYNTSLFVLIIYSIPLRLKSFKALLRLKVLKKSLSSCQKYLRTFKALFQRVFI